ncbi:RICIN domain-containing protein [Streptomyces spectabilis]|uniref:Ricin-type beta-trefoil lectin domain protein n=1 Tax=Streptomyces spectabilis TaxID=68270 RepID=A0A516RFW6_STRST|nr:RICIN domain-containing protein [Streptomyces spectabilis]QDQ14549.1 ricin-type beta-trefoil lectin domain protein [Streptomyces spectabilis]
MKNHQQLRHHEFRLSKNQNSYNCLEVEGSNFENGARVQRWDCNGQEGSYWNMVPIGGNAVEIRSWSWGKCLEVDNGSTGNGARVQIWDCKGYEHQRWFLDDDFGIRNVHSGKVLEIEDSSTSNGARAQQWSDAGKRTQRWYWNIAM